MSPTDGLESGRDDGRDDSNVGSTDVVRIDVAAGVLTATLADVDNRNALGAGLLDGLRGAIRRANADDSIRAVVVTNLGSTFCAGANLKQQSDQKASGKQAVGVGGFPELLHEIQTSKTPIIGRIDGHVVGGGNGLASALDISIAREDVKFGFTEVRLGVVPAIISVVCLPKMRRGEAMEAFLRGHRFSGTRAAELGLINRAVPGDQLDAAVEEVLADLRKGGPEALGLAKSLVYEVPRREMTDAIEWTTALSGRLFAGEEAKEGMKAFLEKRPASWASPKN
ncbi:MAG: enoyl-CoA hydratase-related protein [Myxococcales bacterium]|nr:enoyl-CoA hydratase [Myxococcales bacterium]HIK84327.1 enoyl-CoA hydratase [Myxococcales bacterium]